MRFIANLFFALLAVSHFAEAKLPPRKTVPGFRTSSGLQFHESCFELLKRDNPYDSRQEFEKYFEDWAKDSFDAVTKNCATKYPEFKRWTEEWATQFQRGVVYCPKEFPKSFLDAGMVAPASGAAAVYWFDAQTRQELDIHGLLDSLHSRQLTTVIAAPQTFKASYSKHKRFPRTPFYSGLIHEFFHGTTANNRFDHDEIEYIPALTNGRCGDDVRQDRITLLENLCSQNKQAEVTVHVQVSDCGMKKGCIDIFSKDDSWDGFPEWVSSHYVRARSLSQSDAVSVCKRIKFYGDSFWNKDESKIIKHTEKIRARLYLLFPQEDRPGISRTFFNTYPDIFKAFQNASQSVCFSEAFEWSSSGSLLPKAIKTPFKIANSRIIENSWAFRDPTPKSRAYASIAAAKVSLDATPSCSVDTLAKAKVEDALSEYSRIIETAFRSGAYTKLYRWRHIHKSEQGWTGQSTEFATLIGIQNYDTYLQLVSEMKSDSDNSDRP